MAFEITSSIAIIQEFAKKSPNEADISAELINAFRCLRNAFVHNENLQSTLENKSDLVKNTQNILCEIMQKKTLRENDTLCLSIGLQFLGNFIVNNKENKVAVWSICRVMLNECLNVDNEKVQIHCLMILYNIFLGNPQILENLVHPYEQVIQLALSENPSEYALFIIELFITNTEYLKRFYTQLSIRSRLVILEEIQRLARDQTNLFVIPTSVLEILTKEFSRKAYWVLNKFNNEKDDMNVLEIVKTLDALVVFSTGENVKKQYLEFLQKQASLYIDLVALLKAVHLLSKEKGNKFTMQTKISDNMDLVNSEVNVVFGFKATLIRIIGNMSWRNKKLQDIARDLEGIQIILDCCVIDAKNPFILQWSILAIRNMCENNPENQKVIAEMTKEGVIDVKHLQELGITLNSGNGTDNSKTIVVAPLISK